MDGKLILVTDNLSVSIPSLPRPTLGEIQKKYPRVEFIERDMSPEDQIIVIALASVVLPNEKPIDGQEYEHRLKLHSWLEISLGFQHALWLERHQTDFPDLMNLLGEFYIDFPGIVTVDRDGDRRIPYFGQHGERWYLRLNWLARDFGRSERFAVHGK